MNIKDHHFYSSEWQETAQTLRELNQTYQELSWFLALGEKRSSPEYLCKPAPQVILVEHCFPDEIIRAMGMTPCYLAGGSHANANQGESLVPRDTDSFIKAIVGILTGDAYQFHKNSVILLPMASDSLRKLKDLLGCERNVITYEVPSDPSDPLQRRHWQEEILRVTFELEKRYKRRLSRRRLWEQCVLSENAAQAFREFTACCEQMRAAVSGSARLWIANSYYWCEDKAEWTVHLQKLTKELRAHEAKNMPEIPHLHIMLLGSPIYAPNLKTPFLIEEVGMEVHSFIHPDMAHLFAPMPSTGSRNELIGLLALAYLNTDMSPAYVYNRHMEELVRQGLDKGAIHGVVMHILKGQIEYDFELNRIESMINAYEIPVFRLETDYNYQDVEQLRIRLEAFAEMLRHRENIHKEETYAKKAI